MQSLGKIIQRAPVVGAKMWCVSQLFCLSRSEAGALFVRGDIVRTGNAVSFIGRFQRGLHHFFRRDSSFKNFLQVATYR